MYLIVYRQNGKVRLLALTTTLISRNLNYALVLRSIIISKRIIGYFISNLKTTKVNNFLEGIFINLIEKVKWTSSSFGFDHYNMISRN